MIDGLNIAQLGSRISEAFEKLLLTSRESNLKILAKGEGIMTVVHGDPAVTIRLAEFKIESEPLVFIQSEVFNPYLTMPTGHVHLPYIFFAPGGSITHGYYYVATNEYVDFIGFTAGSSPSFEEADLHYSYMILYEGD